MDIYKKCKVVMIPTGNEVIEKGNLVKNLNTNELGISQNNFLGDLNKSMPKSCNFKSQHLYILSDEELQAGDWVYDSLSNEIIVWQDLNNEDRFDHKIIASTDPKLNLPSPSQAFIKKYVELRGIDEIMVQFSKETIITVDPPSGWKYGFPKQAPLGRNDMLKWFVEQGYPQSEIDNLGDSFTYGCSECPVEILKVSKNNTIIIKAVEVDNQKTIDHILESACGYGMAETDEGKKAFTKCMNSIPKVHFDDFIYTLSRIAEKSGAGGFKNI